VGRFLGGMQTHAAIRNECKDSSNCGNFYVHRSGALHLGCVAGGEILRSSYVHRKSRKSFKMLFLICTKSNKTCFNNFCLNNSPIFKSTLS